MKVRIKLAVINVFFPPQAVGGATRVVADEVDCIVRHYSDQFDVVVFTTDLERQPPHQVTVYPYKGIRVYSVSSIQRVNMDWHPRDEAMGHLFKEFLALESPDMIHFHCVQRLTASVVEAVREAGIPYFVTVHDAWWISDHQFLVDQNGKVYADGHPDPFAEVTLPDLVTAQESVSRRGLLKGLLADSEGVISVSDSFSDLYRTNGIPNVTTIKNGISPDVSWAEKDTSFTSKVVCAHIGGMSDHKGFHLFRQAITEGGCKNIEVLAVDHSKPEGEIIFSNWGTTPVTIIGRVSNENVVNVYRRTDVLFAPSIWPESFGLVTREAAACGCWIVASDVGAIGEDVTSDNGFRISPNKRNLLNVLSQIDRFTKKFKEHSSSPEPRYSTDQVSELVELFLARAITIKSEMQTERIQNYLPKL